MRIISQVLLCLAVNGLICETVYSGPSEKGIKTRNQIGSVFAAPLAFGKSLFFVSTAGVLYESNGDFSNVKKLFEGSKQSIGNLVRTENLLIWGEGTHSDQNSELRVFDLGSRKIKKSIPIKGHVERAVTVSDGVIYVPAGPGGLVAISAKDDQVLWTATTHEGKNLHIDSNIIKYGDEICATTIYDVKGVICFQAKTGKETQFHGFSRNPKSEIVLNQDLLIGFATDADLVKTEFKIPSDFYGVDLKTKKIKFKKELRGFNFFAPIVDGKNAFVTLSTGEFLLIDLETQTMKFLGEYPEPFINNPFRVGADYCGVGLIGKMHCFTITKGGALAVGRDERTPDTVVGRVSVLNGKWIIPTRIGYRVL